MQIKFNKFSSKYFIILNQSIVSLGNFLLSVVLIKFLGLKFFGTFSLIWISILFINSLQLSLIISPLMTSLPKQLKAYKNHYLGGVFIQQIFFLITIFLILTIFLNINILSQKIFFMKYFSFNVFIFIFVSQLSQLLRRFFLVQKKIFRASILDFLNYFIFYFLLFSSLFIIEIELTIDKVFLFFNISLVFGLLVNIFVFFDLRFSKKYFFSSLYENWKISKWITYATIFQWYSSNVWILSVGSLLGPFYVGVIRACQSVINIANLFFQALENYLPSKISEIYMLNKKKNLKNFYNKITKKGIVLTFILSLFIALFSKQILTIIYDDTLTEYYWFLSILSFILPIIYLQFPLNYLFRTLAKTKPIFIAFLFSGLFSLFANNYLILSFNLFGFLLGIFSVQVIILIILYTYIKKISF